MGRTSKLEEKLRMLMQSFMDHSRSQRCSRPPPLCFSYWIDGLFIIHSMYHPSNLIDSPPTILDLYQRNLHPLSAISMGIMSTARSTKHDMKLMMSWAASIARNGNGICVWWSGRVVRKKQIGQRNLWELWRQETTEGVSLTEFSAGEG